MDKITAVGVFENHNQAQAALEALRQAGFEEGGLGMLSRQQEEPDSSAPRMDNPRSAGGQTVAGAGLGAAFGAAAGLGTGLALTAGLVPGIGPVIAGGAMALLMAGTGAAAGSLLGGLLGMGIPQDEAEYVRSELAAGRTLVTAEAGERYHEALRIFAQHGAAQRTIDVGPRS